MKYGGVLSARVHLREFCRSPLPHGRLEIPIIFYIHRGESPERIHKQMTNFVAEYYLEPEKIRIKEEFQEKDGSDVVDIETFCTFYYCSYFHIV